MHMVDLPDVLLMWVMVGSQALGNHVLRCAGPPWDDEALLWQVAGVERHKMWITASVGREQTQLQGLVTIRRQIRLYLYPAS